MDPTNKTVLKSVRFTIDQEKAVEKAARKAGKKFAAYVRDCALPVKEEMKK